MIYKQLSCIALIPSVSTFQCPFHFSSVSFGFVQRRTTNSRRVLHASRGNILAQNRLSYLTVVRAGARGRRTFSDEHFSLYVSPARPPAVSHSVILHPKDQNFSTLISLPPFLSPSFLFLLSSSCSSITREPTHGAINIYYRQSCTKRVSAQNIRWCMFLSLGLMPLHILFPLINASIVLIYARTF